MGKPLKKFNKKDVPSGTIKFTKDKGQHILKNPLVVNNMISKSGLKETDTVIEIGPGTGNLTVKLLEKAKRVHVFEVDNRMVAELEKRVITLESRRKLNIIIGDAMRQEWPKTDLIISNLPYQISSPFVRRLITLGNKYRSATVMVQKEFGDRLIAKPGDKVYSRLTVNTQFHCKVAHIMKVDRNSFRPPPKVDSCVIRIEPKHPLPDIDTVEFDEFLRIVFTRKNKTLIANFNKGVINKMVEKFNECQKIHREANNPALEFDIDANYMQNLIKSIFESVNHLQSRSRTLAVEDFVFIFNAFKNVNIYF